MSLLLHKILEPCLKEILYVWNNIFDLKKKNNIDLPIGTVLGIVNVKSFYTNTSHNLGLKWLRYKISLLIDLLTYLHAKTKDVDYIIWIIHETMLPIFILSWSKETVHMALQRKLWQ